VPKKGFFEMKKAKSLHKSAIVGKQHGSPMSGGQYAVSPIKKKARPDRKGVAKSAKMTAL
jgi:hypothetical protein